MRCARARSEAVQIMLVFDNKPFPKATTCFLLQPLLSVGGRFILYFLNFDRRHLLSIRMLVLLPFFIY